MDPCLAHRGRPPKLFRSPGPMRMNTDEESPQKGSLLYSPNANGGQGRAACVPPVWGALSRRGSGVWAGRTPAGWGAQHLLPRQPSWPGPSLSLQPLPGLGMGLATEVFHCDFCLGSPSVIGEGSGLWGGPCKPHQRLPTPTPQSGDHQESCFPFSPSFPTRPLPLPPPSLSSSHPPPPSQPPLGVPLFAGGSTLLGRLKEPPAPRAGPQNRKTTTGKHRKGEKPQNSGLPLSTNNQVSRQGARLC